MVPILNRMLVFWYDRLVRNHQTKLEFRKNFLPIRMDHFEAQKEQKLAAIEERMQAKLFKYEIKAGIQSESVKEKRDEAIKAIEDKYYWKSRALKQKHIRRGVEDKAAEQALNQSLNQAIEKVRNHYQSENPSSADIAAYETAKKNLTSQAENLKSAYLKRHEKRVETFKHRLEEMIRKHELALVKYQKKLDELEKNDKGLSLPEGILLKVDDLSMHFGGLKAVDELAFEVKEGEIFGLIGPNGAGKTTVFNCITRFYRPTKGHMYFKNKVGETVYLNNIVVHNIIKEGIVRTFQNVEMVWELNVIENLLVAAHTQYRSGFFGHLFNSRLLRQEDLVLRAKAMKILKDLGLEAYALAYPYGLPYGILKKIELARTLMINPKLIILDEPAAGLNDAETEGLAETIKKIQKEYNATIFLVEHDMGLVMNICDTVCAISFGKKLAIGTPKEIQNNKVVREAYLGGE